MDLLFGGISRASDAWRFAIASLPGYPIERIKTGQFTDAGAVWRAEINLNE